MRNYNLLKDLMPKAHHSKNGFDRSERSLFSMKAGMLLPVNCIETVPDGYYELDIAALARTLPMVSAPYTQMTLHFDTFFVPYSQLWHGWDAFRSTTEDYDTSYRNFYNYIPQMDMENFWSNVFDIYEGEVASSMNPRDVFGKPCIDDILRIAGMLGYGSVKGTVTAAKLSEIKERAVGKRMNVWRAAAYQKIFQDHYMNPYYELPNTYFFNFDDVVCSTTSNCLISNTIEDVNKVPQNAPDYTPRGTYAEVRMFIPRYRRWKQDLFMGLLPNSQDGNVSMMPGTDFTLNGHLADGEVPQGPNVLNLNSSGVVGRTTAVTAGNTPLVFSVDNLISVLDERRAKALQRWKETTIRAGFRSRSQAIAHTGVAPYSSNDNRVRFLGSSSQVISIDEVVATAQTGTGSGQSLGDIGGKGIAGFNGQKIKFEASEFGIIMTLASIEPMCLYSDEGLSPFNLKMEQFDYYTEEFESLGFSAVPSYLLRGYQIGTPGILGYAPPYYEYKTSIDRVHGEFETDGSLSAWAITRNDFGSGDTADGMLIQDFYIRPEIVDSIFGVASDNTEVTDQFWLTCVFDVKAVQPMSILGLPY